LRRTVGKRVAECYEAAPSSCRGEKPVQFHAKIALQTPHVGENNLALRDSLAQ
jgi:hypothetical protein